MAGQTPKAAPSDTRRIQQWDRQHLWHPFTQHKLWNQSDPLVIVAGRGDMLVDADGRKYIDGVASIWCSVHGHNHPRINQAIVDQLGRIAHCTLLGLTTPRAVELARRLVALTPETLSKVFFSDDGSTAVEIACKMAFAYWHHRGQPKRRAFVALHEAYHGDTIGSVSVGGIEIFHKLFGPLLFETHRAPAPYCYRCPLGRRPDECNLACPDKLGELLAQHYGQIAAVVVEPLIQCAAGMIVHPKGYLHRVRQLCDEHDVLLIADEVATGFGRTGTMFACEQEDVVPDLMCLSKGLTGGYLPLAATLTTDDIYNAFLGDMDEQKTFYHGHTYTGNALGCAAALANIELFEREQTLTQLPAKADCMRRQLATIGEHENVGDVRQCGLVAGVELVAERASSKPFAYSQQVGAKVCMHARQYGVIIRPLADVIVLFPPLSISMQHLEKLISVTARCINEVLADLPAGRADGYEG